jgi:hypothetical protein
LYEKAILLLQSYILSLQEQVDDKTGIITPHSKKQAADNIADYKQAIVVLKRAQISENGLKVC